MHNELRYIYYKGSIIDLLGLENSGDCSGLINEDNKDHYKIALVHQPDYFTQIKRKFCPTSIIWSYFRWIL